jgi:hypothetical protein
MATALYISHFELNSVGHGGYHRTYQIWHELSALLGTNNVITQKIPSRLTDGYKSKYKEEVFQRLNILLSLIKNQARPHKLLEHLLLNSYPYEEIWGSVNPDIYLKYINEIGKPTVCFLDHPSHANLVAINKKLNIPTVICPHNIESLDRRATLFMKDSVKSFLPLALLQELDLYSRCQFCLLISKVEAGFVGGLGLSADYYPYIPNGVIKERLDNIRRLRLTSNKENFFLLLGSASHSTTGKGQSWLIDRLYDNGIPMGASIKVCGKKTNLLINNRPRLPGLDVLGWVNEPELENLMVRTKGILIPQFCGFGALTRLPEFICAGIPIIASKHPTYALNLPDGVVSVNDNWEDWKTAIENIIRGNKNFQFDYDEWEEEQPRPLEQIIQKFTK